MHRAFITRFHTLRHKFDLRLFCAVQVFDIKLRMFFRISFHRILKYFMIKLHSTKTCKNDRFLFFYNKNNSILR